MKNYTIWHNKKQELDGRMIVPNFSERDIWWCSLGLNIGYEEDGKNENFERPVCVLKKFNKDIFIGLPLTSTRKDNKYYYPYVLHNTPGTIILSQARLMSVKRLQRRLGRIGKGKFSDLKKKYIGIYG